MWNSKFQTFSFFLNHIVGTYKLIYTNKNPYPMVRVYTYVTQQDF